MFSEITLMMAVNVIALKLQFKIHLPTLSLVLFTVRTLFLANFLEQVGLH